MKKENRQRLIKTALLLEKSVFVNDLSARLNVTARTIRNDLHDLSKEKLCHLFYGGAKAIDCDEQLFFHQSGLNTISTHFNQTNTEIHESKKCLNDIHNIHIYILGSFNVDIVSEVEALPKNGESVISHSTHFYGGGKGANQAIAAAKINPYVHLLIKTGQDEFGNKAKRYLQYANLYSLTLLQDPKYYTGNAIILVSCHDGQNVIAIDGGANCQITAEEIINEFPLIKQAKIFLTQLENNIEITQLALEFAKKNGVKTILNPTPYTPKVKPLLPYVDIITPNEIEASDLSGIHIIDHESAKYAAEAIYQFGVKNVIITLGDQGCLFFNGERHIQIPAFKAAVVDSSGAGDSFNGALAASLAKGQNIEDALRYANAFSSLKVERKGASNMPEEALVKLRLAQC